MQSDSPDGSPHIQAVLPQLFPVQKTFFKSKTRIPVQEMKHINIKALGTKIIRTDNSEEKCHF
jgi:hypothetical protein